MVKSFHKILHDWLVAYTEKPIIDTDDVWLAIRLERDLPDWPQGERETFAKQSMAAIHAYSEKREALRMAESRGMAKESWLASDLRSSVGGMSTLEYGRYLEGIDLAIAEANRDLACTVFTKSGNINQNPYLYGFLFEAEHAASFNMDAALKNKDCRAKVLRPESGETYAKNSPDLCVKDGDSITQTAQAKCYDHAKGSNAAFEVGDYGDQTRLVPKGHMQENSVERLVHDGVESKPISPEDVKREQKEVWETGQPPEKSWNDYEVRDLALHVGKQAAISGLQGAAMGAGWAVVQSFSEDKELDGEVVAQAALEGGARSGVTCAVAGAIKVYLEQNSSDLVFSETVRTVAPLPIFWGDLLRKSPTAIGMVASTAMESACIAWKVAKGEMTANEGILEVEKNACAVVAGTCAAAKGTVAGSTIGAILGPVGATIGGFVGGTLGYVAGSAVGKKVCEGIQKVRDKAAEAIRQVAETMSNAGRIVLDRMKGIISAISGFF